MTSSGWTSTPKDVGTEPYRHIFVIFGVLAFFHIPHDEKRRKNGAMASANNTVGILLAAGAGSRFGGENHKLHADIGGIQIWEHSLRQLIAADIGPTIVVTGAIALDFANYEVHEVHNHQWSEGQSTSLRAAIDVADQFDAEAAIVGLADQPDITTEAWIKLAHSTSSLATALYDNTPGHPVRIVSTLWPELPESGDFGARALLSKYERHVERIPCSGSPFDIDTTKDLDEWLKQSPTNSP